MKSALLLLLTIVTCIAYNSNVKNNFKTSILYYSQHKNELEKSKERGNLIYSDFCVQCHLSNGKGVPSIFPPLDGSDWLKNKRDESIYIVKYGQSGEITVNGIKYNNVMLPMGLTDMEIADVMNYVMNSWSNTQSEMVTEKEVKNMTKIINSK